MSIFILCSERANVAEARRHEPVYWNTSNTAFQENMTMEVNIKDSLDVICPRSDNVTENLYLKIYLVKAKSYLECNAFEGKRLITCNVPTRSKEFTFYFGEISASPWGLEFEAGKSYYIISTSNGTRSGISSLHGGMCSSHNMKMKIKVWKKPEEE